MRATKRWLWAMGMGLAAAAIVAFGVVAWTAFDVHASEKPDWLGNSPENLRRLTANADPSDVLFYAVGDLKDGTLTFERLLDIVADEELDFLVILGDFVSGRTANDHQVFIHEMGEEGLGCPVLLVPGSHDMKGKEADRLADFEHTYGPAQFHFTIGDCLFVGLSNAPSYAKTEDYLRYLDQALSEHADEAKHVFVFAHVPPMGLSPSVDSHKLHGSERFRELVRKHGVDYVFCGDHDGHWKGKRDGTTHVICGGGGARLRGRRGHLHHAARIAVENGSVSKTIVAIESEGQGLELLERNIVVSLWPLLTGSWVLATLTALCLLAALAALVVSATQWRRLRAKPRP